MCFSWRSRTAMPMAPDRAIGRRSPSDVIDLSADFRLRRPDDYPLWYGHPHEAPAYLERFVYGIPELHRKGHRRGQIITRCRVPCYRLHLGAHAAVQA